jgi:hypothetical protein
MMLCASCEDIFFHPDPPNTPESNFEVFWTDYDRYYPFFELKHLNWDSIYDVKRPLVTPATNSGQLFGVFGDMIQYLEDGHADLDAQAFGRSRFDFMKDRPVNRLNSVSTYVSLVVRNRNLSYGVIDNDIGYIAIRSFSGVITDYAIIDEVLAEMQTRSVKGIIIDIRGNGGGIDLNSSLIARRFTDHDAVYSYVRFKEGPSHGTFGEWRPKTIGSEEFSFSGRVMVLTNRQVYSSAEDFVMAMRVNPGVTIVGDTTGGGSGNPMLRTLPNGWTFRVPRWQQVDADMNYYENTGLAPDIAVWLTEDDIANNKDRILERALQELRSL